VTIVARAPGKVFLTGEYAVLTGAPAVVVAVDRYAECRVTPLASGPSVVESLVEGCRERVAEQRDGDAGAIAVALHVLRDRLASAPQHVDVLVDSRPFLVGRKKLGLGRSAATLAAAVAALLGRDGADDVLTCALAANELFQDGRGSGADVAAAVHGGVIEARRTAAGLAVAPRVLPAGLQLLVGWTGESASTLPLLERFAAAGPSRTLDRLAATAESAADAVGRGDAPSLLAAVDRSAELLAELGREAGIPIVTPALERLVACARQVGAVAKPSGAGGGDCGIALVASAAQADAVRAAWGAAGIVALPLDIAPDGVRVAAAPAVPEASLG
jgi:phosphomevalonate kinase